MNQKGPSAEVLSFIDRHIVSVEQLEILLFLLQWKRGCTAAEIFREIQSSQVSIDLRLHQLESAGLILRDAEGRCRINQNDRTRLSIIADLAEAYRTMRVRIIEAIYTPKTDAVRTFADAFKLKRKD